MGPNQGAPRLLFSFMLRLAIQKSGRLSEDSLALIRECGISFVSSSYKLKTEATNFPLEILFLRDDDIPGYVQDGVADLGIVGQNVLIEAGCPELEVEALGFSKCRLSLAVPRADAYASVADLQGGTFTITNGGVFGSMLSTPIINAPQSAILGMHNIIQRPVAENGQVVIRPMMYLALSYDHRIIDGRESVSFLVRVKELLEDPTRLLLGV
ncbi:MAG: hypothetical protein NVSMB30_16620 [Hymenobacter sp.]